MARYIDADQCDEIIEKELGIYDTTELKEMLSYFPTADVQEVKHGEWIKTERSEYYNWECSLCNGLVEFRSDYCPECGAKMVEEKVKENN